MSEGERGQARATLRCSVLCSSRLFELGMGNAAPYLILNLTRTSPDHDHVRGSPDQSRHHRQSPSHK